MTQFETGKTYYAHSVCDHDTVFTFKIIRRTAKTVWVEVHGEVVARRIEVWDGVESFSPFGKHSMSAIISASREAQVEAVPPKPSYEVITEAAEVEPVLVSSPKARPVSVKLARAEGFLDSLFKVTIEKGYPGESDANLIEQANSVLKMWALAFPPVRSDKVDFSITFDDGEVYSGCYLLEKSCRFNASLQSHMANLYSTVAHLPGYEETIAARAAFFATHEVI